MALIFTLVMERALIDNGRHCFFFSLEDWLTCVQGIRCLRIDQMRGGSATKKFRTDPNILVLLLHGYVLRIFFCVCQSLNQREYSERENAGLNVTCASRVFLLESVVHHGFEIQG